MTAQPPNNGNPDQSERDQDQVEESETRVVVESAEEPTTGVVLVPADNIADLARPDGLSGLDLINSIAAVVALVVATAAAIYARGSVLEARRSNALMDRSEQTRSRPWVYISEVAAAEAYIDRTAEGMYDATFRADVVIENAGGFIAQSLHASVDITREDGSEGGGGMTHGLPAAQMLVPGTKSPVRLIGYSRLYRAPRPDDFVVRATISYKAPGQEEEYTSSHMWMFGPQGDEPSLEIGQRLNARVSYKGVKHLT